MTRYVIIGAGAIGGTLGGRLAQHGFDTVLVARGEHAKALKSKGLRLRTPDEDVTFPVTAAAGPEDVRLDADDVLVVATKTHQATAALAQWVDSPVYRDGAEIGTAGEVLPVMMALNGVASESIALRYFARVFGICVWLPAVHLEPGEVIIRSAPTSGLFHVGRFPAAAADESDRQLLKQLQADWTAANFKILLPEEVMDWKYNKLLSNIGNVFQALVGANGDHGPLAAAARDEARAVLDAAGIRYVGAEEEAAARADGLTVRPVPGEPEEIGGSSWQSLARGTGNIETDYLNGEIAYLARQHQVAAPINAKVTSLGRIAAATGQRPGTISADELRGILQL